MIWGIACHAMDVISHLVLVLLTYKDRRYIPGAGKFHVVDPICAWYLYILLT